MRWIRNQAILIDMILFSDVAIEDLQCTGESLLAAIFGLKQCSQNVRNEKMLRFLAGRWGNMEDVPLMIIAWYDTCNISTIIYIICGWPGASAACFIELYDAQDDLTEDDLSLSVQPLMCTLSGPDGTIAEVVVRSKRVKCRLNKFIILNSSMHRILWWPICCKLIYNKQILGAIHLPCPSWAMGFGCLRAAEKVPNFFFLGGDGG